MRELKSYYQFERSDWDAVYSPLNRVGRYQHYQMLRTLSLALKRADLRLSELGTILDVGCGQGGWLNTIADIRGSADGLHGIDISPERLEVAKRMNPGIAYSRGDMRDLAFPDESFDLVMTFASLMFLPDEKEFVIALTEMSRVLRTGGHLLLLEPRRVGHTEDTRGTGMEDLQTAIAGGRVDLKFTVPFFRRLGAYSTASLIRKLPEWVCHLIDACGCLPAANYLYVLKAK